jgi:hypothetical protein
VGCRKSSALLTFDRQSAIVEVKLRLWQKDPNKNCHRSTTSVVSSSL